MGRFARKEPISRSRARSANANVKAAFTERNPAINAWRSRKALTSSRVERQGERIIKFDKSSGSNMFSRFFKGRFALSGRKRKVARLATVAALALVGLMIGWSMGGALTETPAAGANKISTAQTFTSAAPVVEQSSSISAVQPEQSVTQHTVTEQPSAGSEPKSRRARGARQRGNYAGSGFNPTIIVTKPARVIKKANPLKIGKIF
jgi:hypothetical protein